jgi:hypothetical protein
MFLKRFTDVNLSKSKYSRFKMKTVNKIAKGNNNSMIQTACHPLITTIATIAGMLMGME